MKIDFYLMTKKGYDVLKSVINNGFINVIGNVIIGEDKNVDNDFYKEIEYLCKEYSIIHYKKSNLLEKKSNYSIAISWRWLIDESKTKLIVLHDSILPKYRGFAPLVNSLINKEKFIGVTALYANASYDKGEIIIQEKTEIIYPIKVIDAINILSEIYINIVLKIITKLLNDQTLNSCKQNETEATYSLWRDEDDYFIDWTKDSEYIKRFIDAVSTPYRGAKSLLNNQIVRILDAEVINDVFIVNRDVGKIIFIEDIYPTVVCGSGLLKIKCLIDEQNQEILPLKNFRLRFKKKI